MPQLSNMKPMVLKASKMTLYVQPIQQNQNSSFLKSNYLDILSTYAVNIPVNSPIITENTKAPKKSSII